MEINQQIDRLTSHLCESKILAIRGHQKRLKESLDLFASNIHSDYIAETSGWVERSARRRALPYATMTELEYVQYCGWWMLKQPSLTTISIFQKLVSYAIGSGHTYTVAVRRGKSATDAEIKRSQDAVDRLVRDRWVESQEEHFERWVAGGECFRWMAPGNNGRLNWHYLDAHEVRPPSQWKGDPARRPAFGIEYEDERGRIPKYYWINNDRVPRLDRKEGVLHQKYGVSQRDPRGVPLMWMGYPNARRINTISECAHEAGIAYAEHTVVYSYGQGTTNTSIDQIAKGLEKSRAEAAQNFQTNAGGVHHAKGHQIEMLSADFRADGWIQLIANEARVLGSIACVPEFMIHGQADTGSRNTLISAEAPMTRRVQRLAHGIATADRELLYHAIATEFGQFGNSDWLEDFRDRVSIQVEFGLPDTQERWRREQSIMDQYDRGLLDWNTAVKLNGNDPDSIREGMEADAEARNELRERRTLNSTYGYAELNQRYKTYIDLVQKLSYSHEEACAAVMLDPAENIAELERMLAEKRQSNEDLRQAMMNSENTGSENTGAAGNREPENTGSENTGSSEGA